MKSITPFRGMMQGEIRGRVKIGGLGDGKMVAVVGVVVLGYEILGVLVWVRVRLWMRLEKEMLDLCADEVNSVAQIDAQFGLELLHDPAEGS